MTSGGGLVPLAPPSLPCGSMGKRGKVTIRRRRTTSTIAVVVAVLGAVAIMVSPVTPWTLSVAFCGVAGVILGVWW